MNSLNSQELNLAISILKRLLDLVRQEQIIWCYHKDIKPSMEFTFIDELNNSQVEYNITISELTVDRSRDSVFSVKLFDGYTKKVAYADSNIGDQAIFLLARDIMYYGSKYNMMEANTI